MSSILVRDLALSKELDRASLCAVRGGNSWLSRGVGNVGPLANVTVNVNQNIAQLQSINVNTLNNSIVGPDFGPVRVNVNPSQWAGNFAAV
ncbi:hypothetical protein CF68_02430 [Cupriavidus sp. SK-4]|uniref:hypothetical protein n=1 Tax=Cupriavidus sp. SK-4 TaxID=574750 RepID=UPI00044B1FDE|nr:hypothetical protein [Cupriavidus sp. SK-4]EYS97776.1 hypothetical protein CF68_02430 [Cupriavidus sp. SK-4]